MGGGWGLTVLKFSNTSGLLALGLRSQITLENLQLLSNTSSVTYGLDAESSITLDKVQINGFGKGLHIRGSYAHNKTNANGWFLNRVTILNTGNYGFYVEGDDGNAGLAQLLNIAILV
ncbi:MAG: hypothetical protein HC877_18975 [Thioploca sp.]|nr:hypothetical protein [Thioploca sp.]